MLEKLTQEPRSSIHGAGRTDAGVHAAGQVANFKTESPLCPEDFQRACNALLPPSIRVIASDEAAPDFHSRWNATAKTYRYRIFRGRIVPPFIWRYVHQDSSPLDFAAMAEAARQFEGEHDFTTFAASTGSEEDDRERITTRTIFRSELLRCAEQASMTVIGRGMGLRRPRKIVPPLHGPKNGRDADGSRPRKTNPGDIPALLAMRDRSKSGPTMPPQGLVHG